MDRCEPSVFYLRRDVVGLLIKSIKHVGITATVVTRFTILDLGHDLGKDSGGWSTAGVLIEE